MKTPENTPIEELFKYQQTALLFMAMAVLVAPLVEETLFRGYLYPLFARSFGVAPSIVVTGVLFGLMHGAQLGWTWSLVAVMSLVGIIFTARPRAHRQRVRQLSDAPGLQLLDRRVSHSLATHGFTQIPSNH